VHETPCFFPSLIVIHCSRLYLFAYGRSWSSLHRLPPPCLDPFSRLQYQHRGYQTLNRNPKQVHFTATAASCYRRSFRQEPSLRDSASGASRSSSRVPKVRSFEPIAARFRALVLDGLIVSDQNSETSCRLPSLVWARDGAGCCALVADDGNVYKVVKSL
jgi:hypothetical protein